MVHFLALLALCPLIVFSRKEKKSPPPTKTRVGKIFITFTFFDQKITTQVVELQLEKKISTEKTASGIPDYGYRYYSSGLGRWLGRDPIGELGGLNLYGMVWNDAMNYVDLYGLKTCWKYVKITHFGDLPTDKLGNKGNTLKPGDIAVGHTGKNQMPTKTDKLVIPNRTPVNVYPSRGGNFPGQVADVGGHDKHPNIKGKNDPKFDRPLGPSDWIDVWDPEKSKKKITDYGWISIEIDECENCPSGWKG